MLTPKRFQYERRKKNEKVVENKKFTDVLTERITSRFDLSQLPNIFAYVAGTIGDLLIGAFAVSFITFFFLKEKNMFREGILLIVPTEFEAKVGHILDSISYPSALILII